MPGTENTQALHKKESMLSATANSSLLADLDAPEASEEHGRLIRSKPFLKKVYEDYYRFFLEELRETPSGLRVEVGSGGGFICELIPDMITSDVVKLSSVQMTFSALALPFASQSLSALCMINVLHHLPHPRDFFTEVSRCLKPGGKLLMAEPANTFFARFVYQHFHHEPFNPHTTAWELPPGGRMSGANGAMPWMVFCRDRRTFEHDFPQLRIERLQTVHPLRYLISGGLTLPALLPAWSYPAVTFVEALIKPLNPLVGLFMQVVLTRK
jgi:SAM-dependent methyltransferase